jgi:aspartyl-tRNA(Asn)/glutamyl-tRNA(Gln) amidotransferase subunit A
MMDVLAGYHPIDRFSLPDPTFSFFERINDTPSKLRIGYSLDLGFAEAVDPQIKGAILDSVEKFNELGWSAEKARVKVKKAPRTMEIIWISGFLSRLGASLDQFQDKMDPELVQGMKAGMMLSLEDIKSAELEREVINETIGKLFKKFDIVVTPTTSCTAFNLGTSFPEKIDGVKLENMASWIPFTYPLNLTGMPAASIPCGWSKEGLPIGMQIFSTRLEDLLVLQVSKAFEELSPWQDRRPKLR